MGRMGATIMDFTPQHPWHGATAWSTINASPYSGLPMMFLVSDEAAEAIRTAYLEKGEWPAVAELRRFYRIEDNAAALRCARTIASWHPVKVEPKAPKKPNK